jgi:hypothetical protein
MGKSLEAKARRRERQEMRQMTDCVRFEADATASLKAMRGNVRKILTAFLLAIGADAVVVSQADRIPKSVQSSVPLLPFTVSGGMFAALYGFANAKMREEMRELNERFTQSHAKRFREAFALASELDAGKCEDDRWLAAAYDDVRARYVDTLPDTKVAS